MPSYIDATNGVNADASFIQQVIDNLKGTAGKGIPTSLTAINDAINYALAVKNNDATASKALIAYKADGTVLLQVDKNGVIASPDGSAGASQIASLTGTQVFSNKSFSSLVTITAGGLEVASGNVGIGLLPNVARNLDVAGTVSGVTTYGGFFEPTMGNATASANALSVLPTTVNSFTTPFLAAFRIQSVTFGTLQSITNFYQEYMDPSTLPAGVTNGYGQFINAPTGASGINLASQFVGGGVVFGTISNAAANYPPNGAVALGTGGAAALTGSIRLPNTAALAWRNAANTSDLTWAVSGADNFECVNAGAVVGRFSGSPAAPQTTLTLLCNDGAVTSLRQVVMGNADSGGAGYRLLRVVN